MLSPFFKFLNFHFIFKELALFPHKAEVLNDPFKEVHLAQLNEADVLQVLL